jgi:threonine 3-dehydrogenase
MHLTNSIGADAAIDITGSGAAIRNGLKCVRAAGRFVGVGLPTKNVELDLANDLIYREIEFTGISGRRIWKTWEDFAMVMKGPYFKADLVTGNSYPLSEYEKAFDEVRTGAAGKVILCP